MDDTIRTTFGELPDSWSFADFCDSSPFINELSDDLERILFGARDFWQLLKGAHSPVQRSAANDSTGPRINVASFESSGRHGARNCLDSSGIVGTCT